MSAFDPTERPTLAPAPMVDLTDVPGGASSGWDIDAFRDLVSTIHAALDNVATIGERMRAQAEADAANIRAEAEQVLADARTQAADLVKRARADVRRALEGVERVLGPDYGPHSQETSSTTQPATEVDPTSSESEAVNSMSSVVVPPPPPASA